jgi:WD40 repeat protein
MTVLRRLGSYNVHGGVVSSLCCYPTEDRLASASHEWDEEEDDVLGILTVWHPDAGVQTSHRDPDFGPWATLSPDGKLLVWGGMNGQLRILDGATASLIDTLSMDEDRRNISHPLFTPDGKHLLTCVGARYEEDRSVVNVWEVSSWRRLFALPTGWVSTHALSADGRTLAVGLVEGGIQMWDMGARKRLASIPADVSGRVRSIAIDPACRRLASTSHGDALKLWDLSDNPPSCRVLQEKALGRDCTVVAFLLTGELLAGCDPGEVCVWDVAAGRVTSRHSLLEGFPDYDVGPGVTALAVSADGSKVAVGDNAGGVSLYAVETGG